LQQALNRNHAKQLQLPFKAVPLRVHFTRRHWLRLAKKKMR